MLARESRHEDPLHAITKYSLRLAWQDVLHQHRLSLILVVCVAAYVGGAVLVAEPLVNDRRYLFVAVPIAAVASLLILGLAGFLVWVVVATDGSGFDLFDGCMPGPSGRQRKRQADRPTPAAPPGPDESLPFPRHRCDGAYSPETGLEDGWVRRRPNEP
jgi:hypothetical protein